MSVGESTKNLLAANTSSKKRKKNLPNRHSEGVISIQKKITTKRRNSKRPSILTLNGNLPPIFNPNMAKQETQFLMPVEPYQEPYAEPYLEPQSDEKSMRVFQNRLLNELQS